MTVVRRTRRKWETPAISLDDIGTILGIPLLVLVTTIVPERLWQPLCYGFAWTFNGFASNARKRRILARLKTSPRPKSKDVYRVASMRFEQRLQTIREWSIGWKPDLRLEGREHLEAALQSGQGAVLWIARFSFASLAEKIAFAENGFEVHHVTRPQHGFSDTAFGMKYLNPIRNGAEYRHAAGRIVINADRPADSMNTARKLLKANKFVSIASGTTEGQVLVFTRFAGKRLRFSAGPARLAKLAGCPLLPVFVVRDGKSRTIRVVVDRPIDLDRGGNKDKMLELAAQEFADRHQPFIKSHPHQWRDWKLLLRRKRKKGQALAELQPAASEVAEAPQQT
jgi:lauroyl/myristoyl acyltransferase